MKRSKYVQLSLAASVAMAISGCGPTEKTYEIHKKYNFQSVQQCADEQTAKATVIALFREQQREVIGAGRLRGPAYEVIEGAEVSKWANGCRRPELVS